MRKHRLKEFISENKINETVKALAGRISEDYKGEELLVLGILKGSVIFMSDLVREIEGVDVELAFMAVSSYEGASTKSSGSVRMVCDVDRPLKNIHVLLVEDIIDTGVTLGYLTEMMHARHPSSFKICSLLDKPSRRLSSVKADYSGLEIQDEFVVGYGLDYDGKYRDLKDIRIVEFI